jgi:HK97 family phage portal protein
LFHAVVSIFSRIFGFKTAAVVYVGSQPVQPPSIVTIPAVVRATQLISGDIGRLPFRVVDADGTTVESNIADLLNREASRWQSGYEFRRFITTSALNSGNGLALIRRDSSGAVAELQPIPDGSVSSEINDEGVTYTLGNVTLTSDQVLHVGCYPDPIKPAWYVGPLDSCRTAMNLAADEDAAHSALVRTGSTGKIAISHPGAMSDGLVENIRNAWTTMHATPEGASRPLILREGMKAEKISQETSTTMLESRRFSIQEIARAFGVPPEMLYQQGGGALASQAETARAYADGAIAQWVSAWESEITRKLLPPGLHARFDTEILVRGSLRDAGNSYSKLVLAGVMSPNDARRRLGLDPLPGLDEPSVTMPGGASAMTSDGNPDAEADNA